jgi:radical SAM superfamily enzyme YgiQ (UPF0313 family)
MHTFLEGGLYHYDKYIGYFYNMPIVEPCIRPPSEAESLLLQVTCGCSCNSCSFCGAYANKPFRIKPMAEIIADINEYSAYYPHVKKVFLMDGDALVLGNNKLLPILLRIREKLPQVNRVSSYANGFQITGRSQHELKDLYDHGLKLIYMGLESGSQEILNACSKKATVEQMVDAVTLADAAGIKTSLMILLGLGGKKNSRKHIEASAAAINKMQPQYLSFLSLMIIPGTLLHAQIQQGLFAPLDAHDFLKETYEMLKLLDLKRTQFYANHASNYVPLSGRLPQGKEEMLALLEAAIEGKVRMKPEEFRGL